MGGTFGTQRPLATQTPTVPEGFSSPDPHPTTDLASVLGSGLLTGKCLGIRRGHKASLYECPRGPGLAPGHYGKLPRNFAGVSRQRPAPAGKGHRVPRASAARSSGTHVGTPGWRPAGPSTPHAGPTRPRHFNFFPWTPEGAGSGRRSRPGATRRPRPRPGSLQARGRPASSRRPARGPALACPAPPTLGAPRLVPRAARPLPPPAGRGPRRAAQKSLGRGGKGAEEKAFFTRPPAPSLPRHPRPLRHSHPGPGRSPAECWAHRELWRRGRRNHGGGAAETAASEPPRPGTSPPHPPPHTPSASSSPRAPRESGSPGPRWAARAPTWRHLGRARPALTHRR